MERDQVTLTVASNLSAIMKDREINASELARRAKINPTGVYDILSGKSRSPRVETLAKLATALNVSIVDFFTSEGDINTRLLSILARLSPDNQQRLLVIAEALLAT